MKTVLSLIDQALTALGAVPKTPYAIAVQAQLKACASNCAAHIAAEVANAAANAATGLTAAASPPPLPDPAPAKPKATTKSVLGAIAAFLGFLWLALPAQAQYQSFHPTNVLTTNWVSAFPTNVVSTNGLGQSTGGALSVANNEFVLLSVSGYVCSNINASATNQILIDLTRSGSANPPQVATGTNLFTGNATNFQATDWDTWSNTVSVFSQIIVPLNLTTGYFRWTTNLPQAYVSAATWLGIGQISLLSTSQMAFITNFDVGICKKIIPIRYP